MKTSVPQLRTVFAKNRTEELGADVFRHFVIPPFFDKLDLGVARKPRLFIGGRGCGKTMLLRYLSHHSAFSKDRSAIPDSDILHIGLYWRVDTQFASIMNARGVADADWEGAFDHLLALFLGLEIIKSLRNIGQSAFRPVTSKEIHQLSFGRLAAFDASFSGDISHLEKALQEKLWEFELWVANVRKCKEPIFLPGVQFLLALIGETRAGLQGLSEANFFVYVDEFENLLPYQQRIINTRVKHSEAPLIFNIAMKRHAAETPQTVGSEAIQNVADYRTHDLELYLSEEVFPPFAAEVLLLNLYLAGINDVPFNPEILQDPGALELRRSKQYQEDILGCVRKMFPGMTHEELAVTAYVNESLQRKLRDRISKALVERGSKLPPEKFMRKEAPQASITSTALLNRERITPEEIALQLDRLIAGQTSDFSQAKEWIHNNFIGCLLWLYDRHATPCPFYSGFETFCLLARGNLRYFLELCHLSLNFSPRDVDASLSVPPDLQARAARQASTTFLNEVRTFGKLGDRLHTFVIRLGSLFALAHRRPTQSEPEQNHFTIAGESKPLKPELTRFLQEAEKWSVLLPHRETKAKDDVRIESVEFMLNPVYAPYFNISFRRIRKLPLNVEDLEILVQGTLDQTELLFKRFSRSWESEEFTQGNLTFQFGDLFR